VQATELSPELADAADVLSDQLNIHLRRLSELLAPHANRLERKFLARLRALKYDRKQRTALAAITMGATARLLAKRQPPLKFIEQVEYHGRRLAKLNLPPSAILAALQEYDQLLAPLVRSLFPPEYTNFQWVRDQLHFCVILTLNNAYYQVREAETQAFYELFRAELESRNLDELLKRFIGTMVEICGATAGQLYLLNPATRALEWKAGSPPRKRNSPGVAPTRLGKLARARLLTPETAGTDLWLNPNWRRRYKSCWSVPLTSGGRALGVMQLAFDKPYEWLPREQELLAAAAERCMMAAEKARLMEDLAAREEQIRRLAGHMLHVEEMERRRISRELHDETGQSLLCVRLQMELLEQSMPEQESEYKQKLRETRDLTERTILEMRRLIAALSPAVLEQLGLGAALRQLVNRFRRLHPARVRLHLSRIGGLAQNMEIIVYRLVQECCNNIAKHSQATVVNISVSSSDGKVKLLVEDNGVGFEVDEAFARRDSFGLSGMRERVALLGGKFQIQSYPAGAKSGSGTRIRIELPVPRAGKRPAAERQRLSRSELVKLAKRTAAVERAVQI
jgi:signal transduction histidine kinase